MLVVNTDKCADSIEVLKKILERKFKHMVSGFVYEFSVIAVDNTPFGNSDVYFELYKRRAARSVYPEKEGAAKAGWQIDINNTTDTVYNGLADSSNAGNVKIRLKQEAFSEFKLGDKLNIGNAVEYVNSNKFNLPSLEQGYSSQAPQGIIKPTINMMLATYKVNLQSYFDKG